MTTQDAGDQTRSDAAKAATSTYIDELSNTVDLGLVTYGGNTGDSSDEYEAGCQDVTLVRGPEAGTPAELTDHIDELELRGFTPIGLSLTTAADALPAEGGTIVLVSDGLDTCAPPPVCEVAADLYNEGVDLVINTVGFNVDAEARQELECIAESAGGTYADASDADSLIDELRKATRLGVGYTSDLPRIDGGDTSAEATPIPDDVVEFQGELPALTNHGDDNYSEQFWSLPVEGLDRVQVTTTYWEDLQEMRGGSRDYLVLENELLVPGSDETCHRGFTTNNSFDNNIFFPSTASVESDQIAVECDTDEIILRVQRSAERIANDPITVELHVVRLAPANTEGLPVGDLPAEIDSIDGARIDEWSPATPGNWFTTATPIETEIVGGENHFYKIPMRTGQQLRGYLEAGDTTLSGSQSLSLGMRAFSPTRQEGESDNTIFFTASEGASDTFEPPVPLTYITSFSTADDSTLNSARSMYTLEGDYYLVVRFNNWFSEDTDVSNVAQETMTYRLVAETVGEPQPGPVFEEAAAPAAEPEETVEENRQKHPTVAVGCFVVKRTL
ncbi:hypothetical protein [Corynebacterium lubricantis]|uniref:hypothetical protein n=1 Tax=Corynebacterium lubricantis TaxID=541095 RepID=UPI000367B7E0|nr:hypothetical protein [Corynebacterium lubricantis]